MKLNYNEEVLTAKLSWERKEVLLPEDGTAGEVMYTVLAYTDDKPDVKKKVYR